MRAEPHHLTQSKTINVILTSDKGKWTPGYPGSPVFTLAGGSGDSIQEQGILDSNTAVVAIKVGTSGSTITLTDGTNKEAVSFSVLTAAQVVSEKKTEYARPAPPKKHTNQ